MIGSASAQCLEQCWILSETTLAACTKRTCCTLLAVLGSLPPLRAEEGQHWHGPLHGVLASTQLQQQLCAHLQQLKTASSADTWRLCAFGGDMHAKNDVRAMQCLVLELNSGLDHHFSSLIPKVYLTNAA